MILSISKHHLRKLLWLFISAFVMLIAIDRFIALSSSDRIYSEINNVPVKKSALVLGTTKYTLGNRNNLYYQYRLDAVVDLFNAKKVNAIVISGDNATRYYNEPIQMQKDLVKRGIPIEYITLDYAGFRTLDSVVRAKEVFGLDEYTIVSQRFHCERALYLAKAHGQNNVIAYQAKSVDGSIWMRIREVLARFNAFLDVNLLNTQPKFLGEKVAVHYRPIVTVSQEPAQ